MKLLAKILVFIFIVSSLVNSCYGQSLDHPLLKDPFPFNYFHHRQDYTYLTDTLINKNWSDNLKFLQIGKSRLAIGGDIRLAVERFKNESWGEVNGNPYVLQRVLLFSDLKFNKKIRLYTELGNGVQYFREGGSRPVDKDIAYIFQNFVDFNLLNKTNSKLTLRAGRQVLDFGTGLMAAVQAGPNLRVSHDGFSAIYKSHRSKSQLFISRPVFRKDGVFDNKILDKSELFWGIFSSYKFTPNRLFDYYYFGHQSDNSYLEGNFSETRHSVGLRYNHKVNGWNFDFESTYQFGNANQFSINAWQFGNIVSYQFNDLPFKPVIGHHFLYASGDRHSNDTNLNTFQAPFQKILVGSGLPAGGNYITFQPAVLFEITKEIKLISDYQFLFRAQSNDAVYGPFRSVLFEAQETSKKFVGNQWNMELHYVPNRHWAFYIKYAPFFNGTLLDAIDINQETYFFRSYLTYFF